MNCKLPILTDSGGFQVMSLSKLNKIDKLYLEATKIASIDTFSENLIFCEREGIRNVCNWLVIGYPCRYKPPKKVYKYSSKNSKY